MRTIPIQCIVRFYDELILLQAVRELRANIEESHNEWLMVKWKDIINIASLKVLSELHLEQVGIYHDMYGIRFDNILILLYSCIPVSLLLRVLTYKSATVCAILGMSLLLLWIYFMNHQKW